MVCKQSLKIGGKFIGKIIFKMFKLHTNYKHVWLIKNELLLKVIIRNI